MIYFDNNATTAVSQEVLDSILPFLQNHYGNPSSNHRWGRENRLAIEQAREKVAQLINCLPEEIYFTGCASEANNTLIKGICNHKKGKHIVTCAIEHPSVLRSCEYMEKYGYEVTYLPVDKQGFVSVSDFENSLRDDTVLASIMHANNEVGTIQPIEEFSVIARKKGVIFHSDVAQSLGKEKVTVDGLGVDMLTIAGHKFHAPKGIGAFYLKKGIELESLIHGTGHEKGKRAGTENLAFCVGLGKACEIIHRERENYYDSLVEMRDKLWGNIQCEIPNAVLNGAPKKRLANTVNISFPDMIGAEILAKTNIAASTGAACTKKSGSFVLRAMGVPDNVACGAVRFSLSKYNTLEEVAAVSQQIIAAVKN